MNRAWTARPTPFLDRFCDDLTDAARLGEIGGLIGHEKEYDNLVDVLARPGRPNAILVGETGSGRAAIVNHLAFEIAHDRVPTPLFDRRLLSLNVGALIAGAAEGELTERVKQALQDVVAAGNVILFIPDIHNLIRSGGANSINAADIMLPIMQGNSVSVIGATTPVEYQQFIEVNSEFAASFETVRVAEISEAAALEFVTYEAVSLETRYHMAISVRAIRSAVRLAHQHLRPKLLPSSASELLGEAIADASQKKAKRLEEADVITTAQRKTNVPLAAAKAGEASELLNLEARIHERLVDQEEAVSAIGRAMREYRAGLSRKGGPIATFLFVGPTGVGKTELAKQLAKIQFGEEKAMLRFDMSEYQDKASFIRFIGSPDGSTRGALTETVREKPYALVLLDEFEKSHPDILNLFLQVFDDGRLTDSVSRVIDFQNTIIIATSNAHSTFIKEQIEAGTAIAQIAEDIKKKLTDFFRAELLNRFSQIVVFKPLSPADIEKIAKLALAELSATLKQTHGIELIIGDDVVAEVAKRGFDPVFGARPLRKVISEQLKADLADKILRGDIARGTSLTTSVEDGKILFQ